MLFLTHIKNNPGRKSVCFLMAVCLVFTMIFGSTSAVYGADQSTVYSVRVSGVYAQTEARKLAELINELRTGKDAWYELMTPSANGNSKKYVKNLKDLTYDYELEELAMLRAAELSLVFSDRRPDGSSFDTVFTADYSDVCESIVAGKGNANAAFAALAAESSSYNGQKDRREMLSSVYNAVACASFEADGVEYWTVLYGTRKDADTDATRSFDGSSTIKVEIADSQYTDAAATEDELTLKKKSSLVLSDPELVLTMSGLTMWGPSTRTVSPLYYTVKSSNSSVVKTDGNKLTAVKKGTATISLSALGKIVKIKVTVK